MRNSVLSLIIGGMISGCSAPKEEHVPEVQEHATSSTVQVAVEPAAVNAITDVTVIGTYTYNDGAHSFVPCGSEFNTPVIPGNELERLIGLAEKQGGSVVLKLEAHTVLDETAEGNDAEKYLAVDKVLGEAVCP